MKILLTGADGFTGHYFKIEAALHGHDVVDLKSDITDVHNLNEEVLSFSPDAVLHLAAISYVGHGNVEDFYRVNLIGTENLLRALVQPGLKKSKVILASSANVYAPSLTGAIKESASLGPINHYGLSKLAMEYMAKTYLDRLSIVITRPFNYTGIGQNVNFIIPKIVSHFKNKLPFIELGNLDVSRDFCDVRLAASIYRRLLEANVDGEEFNICSGNLISLRELIEMAEKITGHSLEVSVNPELVRPNEIKTLCGDSSKLRRFIGDYSSIPLNETLSWMLA